MRIQSRLFLHSLLVTACFTVAAQEHAHVAGQEQGSSVVKGGLWSDRSIWSVGALPEEGDAITIGEGMDIVLDVSPPALHGSNLNGKLSFADNKNLELTTEWILVGGVLSLIGDRENAWTKLAETAGAGSTRIEVLNASQWRAGDEIVLASS